MHRGWCFYKKLCTGKKLCTWYMGVKLMLTFCVYFYKNFYKMAFFIQRVREIDSKSATRKVEKKWGWGSMDCIVMILIPYT